MAGIVGKSPVCSQCERTFTERCNLLRHIRNIHDGVWRCSRCSSTFNREDNYTYHTQVCEFHTSGKRPAEGQIGGESKPKTQRVVRPEWQSQTLNHTVDKHTLDLTKMDQTPETILNVLKDGISNLKVTIEEELEKKRSLKIIVALHVVFRQATDPAFLSEPPPVFKTSPIEILSATDIYEVIQIIMEQLLKKIDDFEQRGSGWVLHELSRIDLHTYVYDPLRASTYIPLPDDLKAKQAVVNIQNKVWLFLYLFMINTYLEFIDFNIHWQMVTIVLKYLHLVLIFRSFISGKQVLYLECGRCTLWRPGRS